MYNERGANFLELGFDWFVLENWSVESGESLRDQHVRLGLAYARLGHHDRRPYIQRAAHFTFAPHEVPLPRPASVVPHDLLSPQKREINRHIEPLWIRTDYRPGTDERHAQLLEATGDCKDAVLGHNAAVMDNAARYSFLSAVNELAGILAFAPVLVEFQDALYEDDEVEWDDPQLQGMFLDVPALTDLPATLRDKEIVHQRDFYTNRVLPGMLQGIMGFRSNGLTLGEMGVGYQEGQVDVRKFQGQVGDALEPWTPPSA
ncbi:uncharacterized protein LTHEOB_5602 [Lasiodiplodia theobromae]|uniref:uncharacterized protein n=1 Tax=Lasiodiplodia theobromae TaxID=45133 RepID=UPI0015C31948|nr:uncharacterized protein LTHEOB_5602 [Lasiodiplodia theobromae]KAF4545191.1 hypothetical protein LTHEOB_5602 [Lasiodiplodia theobromae]